MILTYSSAYLKSAQLSPILIPDIPCLVEAKVPQLNLALNTLYGWGREYTQTHCLINQEYKNCLEKQEYNYTLTDEPRLVP